VAAPTEIFRLIATGLHLNGGIAKFTKFLVRVANLRVKTEPLTSKLLSISVPVQKNMEEISKLFLFFLVVTYFIRQI
jgi:hypothetical protein